MKPVIVFLMLINSVFSQVVHGATAAPGLRVEIHTSSSRVRLPDEIAVTVFFRSPEKDITMWNALGWGASTGLYLQISDSSGHEVRNDFVQMFHPLPPDRTGKNALISIGGKSFVGFDSQIPGKTLFPGPGRYTVEAIYTPPLPRDYFQGSTIWGKEDGPIKSARVTVFVDK